jgi:mannose-6-phosphate isomerase-like protein (cupin superfamily)
LLVRLNDVTPERIAEGVERRTLLSVENPKGRLAVLHHTLTGGELLFGGEAREFQHYIISGCCLYRGRYLHGDTALFVPGTSRFGEAPEHRLQHAGEGELRLLTAIYEMDQSNFRWAKPRSRNLSETATTFSGMTANQLFTEEEHAVMGARRMHSIDLQTHAPGVTLPPHLNPEEFGYILRGEGELISGSAQYIVGPGALIYTDEGAPHSIINAGSEPLQYIAYEFTEQDVSLSEMKTVDG